MRQILESTMANEKKNDQRVGFGFPATDIYPDTTLVSYLETVEGTVTAIYRHYSQVQGPSNHSARCSCGGINGHCLLQVRGIVEPKDAPLFEP